MTKITVKDNFLALRALAADAGRTDLVEFVDSRIAQTDAKNARRSNKPTKAQRENADLAEAVIASMPAGQAMTVSEIQKAVPALTELSNQRATAVIRSLVRVGRLARSEAKGKALFTLV